MPGLGSVAKPRSAEARNEWLSLPPAGRTTKWPVPNCRSPASPSPGMDIATLVERRSTAAQRCPRPDGPRDRCTPSGAAMRLTSLIRTRAPRLEDVDRRGGRSAGREHRIEHEAQVDGGRVGQLVVVLDRSQRPLVAEQAEVPDLAVGISSSIASTMPSPARRIGTRPTRSAECDRRRRLERRRDRTGATPTSASASYPSSQDSSRTSSRNFFGSVCSSRRMASLWRTAGWLETWRVGADTGGPPAGRVPSGMAWTPIVLTRDRRRRGILAFLVLDLSRRSPDP